MNSNKKNLIINADDFGLTSELNESVLNGYQKGILTQSSIVANGAAFEEAVKIALGCKKLAIGVHLNTYEGKSLTQCSKLTDDNGFFNKSFIQTYICSYDDEFLKQIETEWDAQIQKIINSGIMPSHLDSHVHYHAIPSLFKIAVKLAKKYDIKNIRTQREKFYVCKINRAFFINVIKNILLNFFTFINKKNIEINTNEYLVGVLYTSMMNSICVEKGLKVLPNNYFTEVLIHPKKNSEYDLLFEEKLKEFIKREKIILTNYKGELFEI